QRRFVDSSYVRAGFEAGLVRNWRRAKSSLLLDFQQRVFTYASSDGDVVFERVVSPGLKIGHEQTFLRIDDAKLGAALSADYIFGAQGLGVNTRSGYEAELSFFTKHETPDSAFGARLYYRLGQQNTNLADQNSQQVGVVFGYSGTKR